MNFLKENYEKFILCVVLFAVIYNLSVSLGTNYKSDIAQLQLDSQEKYKLDFDKWNALSYLSSGGISEILDQGNEAFLFDKVKYCPYEDCPSIIKSASPKCPFCNRLVVKSNRGIVFSLEDSDSDKIFNKEEVRLRLNPYKKDGFEDNDNDGFVNFFEIKQRTDINDPNDYPPLVYKLSFIKSTRSLLKIILKNVYTNGKEDKNDWEASIVVKGQTKFIKIGQKVINGYYLVGLEFISFVNSKGRNVIKQRAILQKGQEEKFSIAPNKKVYPPRSRKYYFSYKVKEKDKDLVIVIKDKQTVILAGSNGKLEEYEVVKYDKKSAMVILRKEQDYYFIKQKSFLEIWETKNFIRVENEDLEDRRTIL